MPKEIEPLTDMDVFQLYINSPTKRVAYETVNDRPVTEEDGTFAITLEPHSFSIMHEGKWYNVPKITDTPVSNISNSPDSVKSKELCDSLAEAVEGVLRTSVVTLTAMNILQEKLDDYYGKSKQEEKKAKTILQRFILARQDRAEWADEAILEAVIQCGPIILLKEELNLVDALKNAFVWAKSKKGHVYWENIVKTL